MKTPILLVAVIFLVISSCNKSMPAPDTGPDQTFFPDFSYDPSDPSDPGNYSGDNGDDPGNYSGDDGNKYKGHMHHAKAGMKNPPPKI